jgi:hypothetical protein
MKAAEGGQAKVERGMTLGMTPPVFMNGWFMISSREGLFGGSWTNILEMRFLA